MLLLVVTELPDIVERPDATVDIESMESRLLIVLVEAFRGGRLGGGALFRGGGRGGSAGCGFEVVEADVPGSFGTLLVGVGALFGIVECAVLCLRCSTNGWCEGGGGGGGRAFLLVTTGSKL